jgi:hypothetical protein
MSKTIRKQYYFKELGKKGGKAKTEKKIKSSRENGKKGGRPKHDSQR